MRLIWPLDDVFGSRAAVRILRAVCGVKIGLSGRELIRRAKVPYGSGWTALQTLADAGVLIKEDHGKVITFRLSDTDLPLIARIKQLFEEEAVRTTRTVQLLRERFPEVLSIILYGSEARREGKAKSDVDILVIVESRDDELNRRIVIAADAIAEEQGVRLEPLVADLAMLRQWEEEDHPFWRNVERDGKELVGESLGRLARRWQIHRKAT